jgi:hypothetical protein
VRYAHIILVGKPEMKKQLGKPRRKWEDNFGMDVCNVEEEVLDWFYLAQDRDKWRSLVNTAMKLLVP